MPFNIGPLEIIVVLIIVLLVFGPKRLPEMGRSLGRGLKEFKTSLTTDHSDEKALNSAEPVVPVEEPKAQEHQKV